MLKMDKDGMLANGIRVTRITGRYDPTQAPDPRKRVDVMTYDPMTVVGIAARLQGVLFHPTGRQNSKGIVPRLKTGGVYRVHVRVGVRRADGVVTARVREVWKAEKSVKTGKVRFVLLDTKTSKPQEIAELRKLRKANRFLPAAFANTQEPPKRTRSRKQEAEE